MSSASTSPPDRDNDASLGWMRDVQLQQRRGEEENGSLRNLYKRAKAAGENVDAMRRAIRKLRSRSPEEIISDLADEIRYLRLRKVEVTAQSLFDGMDLSMSDKSRQADDAWTAGDKGYRDGRQGVKIDESPYPAGSELFAAWEENWRAGQAAIARELGPDAKAASASRQRPNRTAQTEIPGTERVKRAKPAGGTRKAPAKRKATGGRTPRGTAPPAEAASNVH